MKKTVNDLNTQRYLNNIIRWEMKDDIGPPPPPQPLTQQKAKLGWEVIKAQNIESDSPEW